MPRRRAESLRPKDRRCIKDKVAFGAWIDGRCPVRRVDAALPGRAASDDFQTGNVGRLAVKLPTDQTGNAIALLDACASEHPMIWIGNDPVAAAVDGTDITRAHEQAFVGTAMLVRTKLFMSLPCVLVLCTIRSAAMDNAPVDQSRP